MKISDLGRATGTKPVTIRFYESIGLLPEPERSTGNYRIYNDEHRRRLNFIRLVRELGFDTDDIRLLLDLADGSRAVPDEAIDSYLNKIAGKTTRLDALHRALTRVKADRAEAQNVMVSLDDAEPEGTITR